ncbi:hypothetical protein V7182_05295 [Neobacillus drentensis]|uniref:hypothetical protein n=1 Tax=Neobacillus drentensis TaxID=220684 RepID=UPI002FFF8BB6
MTGFIINNLKDIVLPILTFLGGLILKWAQKVLTVSYPAKKLWKLDDGQKVSFVIANPPAAFRIDESEYTKTVYMLDYKAFMIINVFLSSIYKKLTITAEIEEEFHNRDIRDHLVLIGGPVNNPLTEKVMNLINSPLAFNSKTHEIMDNKTGTQYIAEVVDGSIVKDYGLVIRTTNPYNKENSVTIIAGSRTYGTLASAESLTMPFIKSINKKIKKNKNFAMLLGLDVPGKPEILKIYQLEA